MRRWNISFAIAYRLLIFGVPGRLIDVEQWGPQDAPYVKVNFDTAFRASENISYAGIFIRDHLGLVLGYQSVLSKHVPSPFTAEGLLPCSSTGSEARVPLGHFLRQFFDGDPKTPLSSA